MQALARCVGDVERFRSEDWGRTPALRRNPGTESFDDLLSLDAVDHLVATTSLRLPAFRLVRDGRPVDPKTYTKRVRLGSRTLDDVADVGRVHDLFAEGATIVLQGLQRSWSPLATFCRQLELALDHPVQANAYVTPADAQGLARHHDTHDVLLLQVHGSKHWEVHGLDGAGVVLDTELDPGDTLYVPTGAAHAARSMKTASIHLTLGVLNTTWAQVVERLVARAVDELGLGASLSASYASDEGFAEEARARLGAVAQWLATVDPDELRDETHRRFRASRAPVLSGQLAQILDLDRIDDRTPLRRRPGSVAEVVVDADGLRLVLGDRTLRLPLAVEPVLRRVVGLDELRAGDLEGDLDAASRLVLCRRLVREGLLVAERARERPLSTGP